MAGLGDMGYPSGQRRRCGGQGAGHGRRSGSCDDRLLPHLPIPRKYLVDALNRTPFRLFRDGAYAPLRGTCLELEKGAVLYTRGSVPYFRTYPGLYVPQPIMLRPYRMESTLSELAEETLALTKMNWNSTQFDGSLPITVRASRAVSRILKHVSTGELEAAEYRFYI
jgi:hypothetical protein